jgi:acetyltransferase-like isoleucine patch superfamily enzyme
MRRSSPLNRASRFFNWKTAATRQVVRLRYAQAGEFDRARMFDLGSLGDRVRLSGRVDFGSEPFLIHLGSDITLAHGVTFLTHDGGVALIRDVSNDLEVFGRIVLGDRVFVGTHTLFLPGVHVGSDVVIGAGSVVTRGIPSNTVAAGNPCRPIGTVDDYRRRKLEVAVRITERRLGRSRDDQICAAVPSPE